MAIEIKDFLASIGYEGEAETPDQVVEYLNSKFVTKDKAHEDPDIKRKIEGRVFGEAYGELAKLTDGKFSKSELEKKPFKEAFGEVTSYFKSEVEGIKAKSKEGQSKQLTELQEKLADYEKSAQDYVRDNGILKSKLQEVEQNADQKVRSYIVGMRRKEIESKMPWKEGMTDIERAGLNVYIESNYKIEADESGSVIVKDKDGHTIPSKAKAGEVKTLEDIYAEVAENGNLLKKNNGGSGSQVRRVEPGQQSPTAGFAPRKLASISVPK